MLLNEAGNKVVSFSIYQMRSLPGCHFMRPSHVPNLKAMCQFMRNLINTNEMYIARGIIKLRYSFFNSRLSPIWYRTVDPHPANTVKTMYHDPNFEKDWPEILSLYDLFPPMANGHQEGLYHIWWGEELERRNISAATVSDHSASKYSLTWC